MTTACYPITKPVRTTEPTAEQEPLSLGQAKYQCGIAQDNHQHNEALQRYISGSRRRVEHDAGVVCYTGSFVWRLTEFPRYGDYLPIYGVRPVTSITSITYVATDGDTDTWSSSEYALDTNGLVPIVKLAYDEDWPVIRGDINGITITLVAGYASVPVIPPDIVAAVIFDVRASYLRSVGRHEEAEQDEKAYDRQIGLIRREDVG